MIATVAFGGAILVLILGASLFAYNTPLSTQWGNSKNSNATSFLNSVARFNDDTKLSNSERLDILQSQHLINADQLAHYQLILDEENPYFGNAFNGLFIMIFSGIATVVSGLFAAGEWMDHIENSKRKQEWSSR